ncbi:MAG: SDR family oxidoreductase [Microscillaceae bacterium]
MQSFQDKVVAITGGGSGIGRETALAFARQGAKVSICDLNEAGGQETLSQIEALGAKGYFARVDVRHEAEVQAWTAQTIAQLGGLHSAVNNAGIDGAVAFTDEYPEESFDQVMDINVKGVWYGMKAQLAHMKNHGGGTIVNIASVAGFMSLPRLIAYVASKHAVIGMTRTAGVEYARFLIRVNAVCPSFTETPMVNHSLDYPGAVLNVEKMAQINPSKRIAQAHEIANAILYLCSDNSSYINAHPLVIDGGLSVV